MDEREIDEIIAKTKIPDDISTIPELVALQIFYEVSNNFVGKMITLVQYLRTQPGNRDKDVLELIAIALEILNKKRE